MHYSPKRQDSNVSKALLHGSFFIAAGKHLCTTSMWQEFGWSTFTSKRKLSETLTVFHCVSGSSPLHLSALLRPTSSVHAHNTRSVFANCLSIFQTPSKFGCKSFSLKMEHHSTHNARNLLAAKVHESQKFAITLTNCGAL